MVMDMDMAVTGVLIIVRSRITIAFLFQLEVRYI